MELQENTAAQIRIQEKKEKQNKTKEARIKRKKESAEHHELALIAREAKKSLQPQIKVFNNISQELELDSNKSEESSNIRTRKRKNVEECIIISGDSPFEPSLPNTFDTDIITIFNKEVDTLSLEKMNRKQLAPVR